MAEAPIIGPWEVRGHMTHSGQAGFKLVRRNSAAWGGRQDLTTPTLMVKRFKDRAKAEAHAAKLNAAGGGEVVPRNIDKPCHDFSVCASPPKCRAAANCLKLHAPAGVTLPAAPQPPQRGVEVLRYAIAMLRDEACYRDDEGEDTDALEDLLAWLDADGVGEGRDA